MPYKISNCHQKVGWFLLMFVNLMFSIFGIVICILKLQYDKDIRKSFMNISIVFASTNLILSLLLLAAVIKNSQLWALGYAFLCFINLYGTTMYIEISTTANIIVVIIYSIFAIIGLLLYLVYAIILRKQRMTEEIPWPT